MNLRDLMTKLDTLAEADDPRAQYDKFKADDARTAAVAQVKKWMSTPLNQIPRLGDAIDPKTGAQSCGYATNHPYDVKENALEITTTWEKLDAVAIARCESARPAGLTTPCRVFARRNEIVWGKAGKTGLD